MNESTVAVIGLGLIGSIWAANYKTAGLLTATWNRTPKPGLPFAAQSLRECALAASALHLCLYDADSVREVLQQLIPHLNASHLVIQSSTIDGASASEFAAMVQRTGARYIEAPFTGSKPAAEQRQTVFYLGGDASVVAQADPLLKQIAAKRFHIGRPDQAAAMKLAMNLQIAGITQALCEALTLSRDAGIADESFFAAMKVNVSWSGLSEMKQTKLMESDFEPQFSIKNLHKDLRLAQVTAKTPLPLLNQVVQCLATTENAGYGSDDFISLIRVLKP